MSDVLVLSYHSVSPTWPAVISVLPDRFEAQIALLRERGYRGTTFHQAVHDPPGPRVVAVTFDDAYRSVLEYAFPILERAGFPATVFVPTDFPDRDGPMSWSGIDRWLDGPYAEDLRCLSWPELRELATAGWEIGAHGCSHPYLTELSEDELERELRESRERCEREVRRPCQSLAYPYGACDERVVEATGRAGFTAACTVPSGLRPDQLKWPRVGIYRDDGTISFRLKVSPHVRRLRTTGIENYVLPAMRGARAARRSFVEHARERSVARRAS